MVQLIGDGATAISALRRYDLGAEDVSSFEWASTTNYSAAGTVVRYGDNDYTSSGLAGNTGKNPSDPQNALYWYASPGIDRLVALANKGEIVKGGMHPVDNYQDARYRTSLLLDKDSGYEFYLVHLDGSTVTGDSTLEDILDPGGTKEYPFIDIFAPDVSGTRTLIDSRGYSDRAMTASGGVAATLGEVQMDAAQRVTGKILGIRSADVDPDDTGALAGSFTNSLTNYNTSGTGGGSNDGTILFDNANSTSPNASKTNDKETRVKAIVHGVDYIVVMTEA